MNRDEVDKKIDQILLDSIRNAFIFMNVEMSKEHPEKAIEHEILSYDAKCTSEYLKVLLQLGKKYTQNDYLDSLNKALNEMSLQKGYVKTQIEYIGYLLQNALNGASTIVHKNDIADYAIITMLNEKVKLKAIEDGTKKEDLKLITFDRKLHEFSKQNNVTYDAQIYDEFLSPIN